MDNGNTQSSYINGEGSKQDARQGHTGSEGGNGILTPIADYETALAAFRRDAWHGIYDRYGAIVGREVRHWAAAHANLCAWIGRRLRFIHATPHYGMEYVLLVVSTGRGKTTAAKLAEPLCLPKYTRIETDIQSGQALAEAIATITWGTGRDAKRAADVQPRPTLLRPAEFSILVALGGASTSILLPKLCELYDADARFVIKRVHHNGTIEVLHPEASLFTFCPEGRFQDLLTSQHVSSGLMNRFLILLGAGEHFGPEAPHYDYSAIDALATTLNPQIPHALGQEAPTHVRDFYTPEAWQIYLAWWASIEETVNSDNPLSDWLSRAQAHFHRIALTPVYCDRREHVTEEDARCAAAVLNLSVASIHRLLGNGAGLSEDLPPWKRNQLALEQRVLGYLRSQYPTVVKQRDVVRRFSGGGKYSSGDVTQLLRELSYAGRIETIPGKPVGVRYVPDAEEKAAA